MIFKNSDKFIKFALGENVKQSNWGSYSRFPQTRMGVEQVFVDYFNRALEYGEKWENYNSLSKKYSVIEVSAKDRPGLLNDLTRKISDLSIDIRSAHIATFGERATDVFYVLNKSGEKISSRNKIENIQKELIKSISFSEYV